MFEYKTDVRVEHGFVYVTATGSIDASQVIDMYQDITSICDANGINKILFNAESLTLNCQGLAIVENMHKLELILANYRVARVIKFIDVNCGLIESFSEQKQIDLKNFENEAEAKAWLMKTNNFDV